MHASGFALPTLRARADRGALFRVAHWEILSLEWARARLRRIQTPSVVRTGARELGGGGRPRSSSPRPTALALEGRG
jgi:hypothetical protein